jgi:hypothetical protein
MYQLFWRSLLEPKAPTAAEEWSPIQDYVRRVAKVKKLIESVRQSVSQLSSSSEGGQLLVLTCF